MSNSSNRFEDSCRAVSTGESGAFLEAVTDDEHLRAQTDQLVFTRPADRAPLTFIGDGRDESRDLRPELPSASHWRSTRVRREEPLPPGCYGALTGACCRIALVPSHIEGMERTRGGTTVNDRALDHGYALADEFVRDVGLATISSTYMLAGFRAVRFLLRTYLVDERGWDVGLLDQAETAARGGEGRIASLLTGSTR